MKTNPIEIVISKEEEGNRLDKILASRFSNYSRAYFHYLFEQGAILQSGVLMQKRQKPKAGECISITFLTLPALSLEPQEIPLEILYEDNAILAINKPAGMVVHPAPGNADQTFVNALLFHLQENHFGENDFRPGIIHRLDKETSGVLLAAKTKQAHEAFTKLFANKEIKKTYLAICLGNPGNTCINQPIGRHPKKRKEMTVLEKGKPAITECRTLAYNQKFSYVTLFPQTGRTHQLRVHLRHLNCPILGDKTYGHSAINQSYEAERQLLHAHKLKFVHPLTKQDIVLIAPIPSDLAFWIQKISS